MHPTHRLPAAQEGLLWTQGTRVSSGHSDDVSTGFPLNFVPLLSTALITVTAPQPASVYSSVSQDCLLVPPMWAQHHQIPLVAVLQALEGAIWQTTSPLLLCPSLPRDPGHPSDLPYPDPCTFTACPDQEVDAALEPHMSCSCIPSLRDRLEGTSHLPDSPQQLPARRECPVSVGALTASPRLHSPMLTKLMTRSARPRRRPGGPASSSSSPAMAW